MDSGGHLRLDELGITVTANRIGHQQVEGIAALFEAARRPDSPDDGGQVRIPEPLRKVDDAVLDHGPAPGRGAWERSPSPASPRPTRNAQEQLTELVTYLAMHPRGRAPQRARRRAVAARRDPGRQRRRGRASARLARRRRARPPVPAPGRGRAGSRSARRSSATGTPCARCSCVPARPARDATRWSCCVVACS